MLGICTRIAASQAENAVENSPLYDAIRARLDNRKKKRKGTDVKTPREVPRIELKERRHMVEVVNLASVRKGSVQQRVRVRACEQRSIVCCVPCAVCVRSRGDFLQGLVFSNGAVQ